jgi:putative membrane protein
VTDEHGGVPLPEEPRSAESPLPEERGAHSSEGHFWPSRAPSADRRLDGREPASRSEPSDALPPSSQPPAAAASASGTTLTDGEWHRLHPASPLLKGGIALIAILGVVIANLRERILDFLIPSIPQERDPVDYILSHGLVGWALLAVAVVLVVLIVGFYFSWRMHMFRITNEVVEMRSGILFRTNRKARLDRIQGINIVRPFFARLFGAAKLEINQAGQDANVQLSYLGSAAADDLRREILRLASGTRQASAPTAAIPGQSALDRRVSELLAPELDPDAAPPESIVKLNLGRLIGSLVLSGGTVFILLLIAGGVTWIATTGDVFALFFAIPGLIGFGSFYVRRFTKSLRYSIAGTPDGIRVGFGLLSTSNETLPPGRIHSVQVSQPLLWRLSGWWEIKVNRASHSSTKGAAGEANTTILPVGNREDVQKVLELLLPELLAQTVDDAGAARSATSFIEAGLESKGGPDDGFTNSPRRAAWLRPLSWRRNGFAVTPGSLVLRKGAIWRQLVIVPQPRLQSVSLYQGPVLRMLGLASVQLHTVSGPNSADLGAIDATAAVGFFEEVARVAVASAQRDTSHRWRSGELPPQSPPPAPAPFRETALSAHPDPAEERNLRSREDGDDR